MNAQFAFEASETAYDIRLFALLFLPIALTDGTSAMLNGFEEHFKIVPPKPHFTVDPEFNNLQTKSVVIANEYLRQFFQQEKEALIAKRAQQLPQFDKQREVEAKKQREAALDKLKDLKLSATATEYVPSNTLTS